MGDETTKSRFAAKRRERPTIGLAITGTANLWEQQPWQGVQDAAQAHDANLLVFVGGALKAEQGIHANVIYTLMTPQCVDGFVTGGAMGTYFGPEVIQDFCNRHYPLPVATFEQAIPGFPGVLLDDYHSMQQVVSHLIEVHGCQRIAYMGEPTSTHRGFRERYRAYVETLQAHSLPFDPKLLYSDGLDARLIHWLEERIHDIDALTGQEDSFVLSGLRALHSLGVHVPGDVAVAGFNDLAESRVATPPLTTIRPPFYEMGWRAAEALLAMLAGEPVPEQEVLVGQLIVRQSCGCLDPTVAQVAVGAVERASESREVALTVHREEILAEVARAVKALAVRIDPAWPEQLLNAFATALGVKPLDSASGLFLQELDNGLRQVMAAGGEVAVLHDVLSTLRRNTLPYLDDEARSRAEDLWQQARVVIGQTMARAQAYEALQAEQRAQALREIEEALIVTSDVDGLMDVLTAQLPRLGIPACYLSLYEDPRPYEYPQPAPEWSRLVLAYSQVDSTGPVERIELEPGGRRFRSQELIPEGMWPRGRRYSLMVEPLHYREQQLGFVIFEIGPREGTIYETLRRDISSALHRVLLVQQVRETNYALQRRAVQLEAGAEIGRAITSIFDVDQLLRQTVDLIRDRFGFYHVGIFLLDETGEWAVLREATGEAGAQMKAQGHRLAVDGTSMVGWTALHGEPRIAWAAGKDPVRFAHPLLPRTRSEMTLPLIIGGRVLGVLNVQSEKEAAFDQEDMRVLQSIADQVAIAIENARRLSDEATLLEATSPIYRASRRLTTAVSSTDVADAVIASVAETVADGCTVIAFEFSPEGEPEALLYLGAWQRGREPYFQPGLRLPISESPFPFDLISTFWVISDLERDERLPLGVRRVFREAGARALVNVPLRARERVIGHIVVLRAAPEPFPASAVRLYEALSDQVSVALERAQLLEEARRRVESERLVRQAIDRIRRAVDVEQALHIAARELGEALEVPHVAIELGV